METKQTYHCQVCGKAHKLTDAGTLVRHKPEQEWMDAPEYCAGSNERPYEHACNALAEYRAQLLQQINALALEHLNTAVTENVDNHGRSWCSVVMPPNAFNPKGGVQWVLGRIMQTAPDVVQVLDGLGRLHPLPFRTVRAARKGMLARRLDTLDRWHMAASERAEWCKLRLAQWEPKRDKAAKRVPHAA